MKSRTVAEGEVSVVVAVSEGVKVADGRYVSRTDGQHRLCGMHFGPSPVNRYCQISCRAGFPEKWAVRPVRSSLTPCRDVHPIS